MSTEKEYKKYKNFAGFENLDKNATPYEQMITGTANDMKNRNTDIEVKRIRDSSVLEGDFDENDWYLNLAKAFYKLNNSNSNIMRHYPGTIPAFATLNLLGEKAAEIRTIYKNFSAGGKWDHKVKGKELGNQYYHKSEKNAEGKPAVVFGFEMPGDDKHIYDHDVPGNISYGYTMKASEMPNFVTEWGAKIDDIMDIWVAIKNLIKIHRFTADPIDENMVKLGIKSYKTHKENMDDKILNKLMHENAHLLRRYKKSDLVDRRAITKDGEDAASVAQRYDIPKENLLVYNKHHSQGDLNFEDGKSLKRGIRPILPDPDEIDYVRSPQYLEDMKKQDAEKSRKLAEQRSKVDKILAAFKQNDNPKEDILYKHPSQITQDEIDENRRYTAYEVKDAELKSRLDNKNTEWYDYFYGKEPAKQDGSGRTIQPEAKSEIPQNSVLPKDKDNNPLSSGFERVAQSASTFGVKSLQKGLNRLYSGDKSKPQLKEDGIIGPKTTSRTKDALSKYGADKVEKSTGYGGFVSLMEDNRGKDIDNESLKNTVTAANPQDGGSFLQKGINSLEGRSEKIAEDNDIGEQTTKAFNETKDENEGFFTSIFSSLFD